MRKFWYFIVCLASTVFTSCNDTVENQNIVSEEVETISATIKEFECDASEFSRTSITIEDDGPHYAWAVTDTIGIFPSEGRQLEFSMASGAGTTSATFTGGGWGLKSSSTYAAYFPLIGAYYLDATKIPVHYTGQKQDGNGSTAHLGNYDYMVAPASGVNDGRISFNFERLGCLVQLKITMPQGGDLSSVTLMADDEVFVATGAVSLTAAAPAIRSIKKSKTFTLEVENLITTAEEPVATLYFMMAPVDFTDRTLTAMIKQNNGSCETITLTSKNFEAGKAYSIEATLEDFVDFDVKGAYVKMETAGTLKQLLGANYLNINALTIEGPINGDDVYYLRKMLGGSDFSSANWGKLTTLDLTKATIEKGGEYYYMDSKKVEYNTSNHVIGEYMFYGCANLQSISLPENLISIETATFTNCSSLQTVHIPSGTIGASSFIDSKALASVTIGDGVTSIGSAAFKNCDALTTVTIGTGIETIEGSAFYDCDALTSIEIVKGTIGGSAFQSCDDLESVTIGKEVTSIGSRAFSECISLISVTIPNASLNEYSFYNCVALTTVTLGTGISKIPQYTFQGSKSITEIYCLNTTPPSVTLSTSGYSFDSFSYSILTKAKLYVPSRCGTKYESSNWGDFTNIIEMD